MSNLAQSQQRTLGWLTGIALMGFAALSYLAFHQPILPNAKTINANYRMISHLHHEHDQSQRKQTDQISAHQQTRWVQALLVMGGLGCH